MYLLQLPGFATENQYFEEKFMSYFPFYCAHKIRAPICLWLTDSQEYKIKYLIFIYTQHFDTVMSEVLTDVTVAHFQHFCIAWNGILSLSSLLHPGLLNCVYMALHGPYLLMVRRVKSDSQGDISSSCQLEGAQNFRKRRPKRSKSFSTAATGKPTEIPPKRVKPRRLMKKET